MREMEGQISLDELLARTTTRPEPPKGVWDLPGFEEERERLRNKGFPYGWIDKVVTPDEPGAVFVKKGVPFARSDCPDCEGIWLSGGFSSVQCKAHDGLLPGMMWDKTCGKNKEQCPFRKQQEK